MRKDLRAIRGIEEETYLKFREKALAERMKVGEALTLAMKEWLKKKRTKINPRNLLRIKGIIKTKENVRWSEEIDEILVNGMKRTIEILPKAFIFYPIN
jgi:uncharacterized FlgJ-related protein